MYEPTDAELFIALTRAALEGQVPLDGAPETERIRAYIVYHLERSTVLQRYLRHLNGIYQGASNTNTEPWQAEGERQWAAFAMAHAGVPPRRGDRTIRFRTSNGDEDDATSRSYGLASACIALTAQVYLWSNQTILLARGAPLPRHVVSAVALPYPVMFWSNEAYATALDQDGVPHETNWLLVQRRGAELYITTDLIRQYDDGTNTEMALVSGTIPTGRVYPDEYPGRERDAVAAVLGRLAFLNSPYIGLDVSRLPRPWRRHGLLPQAPEALRDPQISVVSLRREASASVAAHDAVGDQRVYRHQWWVSGDIRSQWYPAEQAHHLKWIAPYLKGPPDGPLLPKVYAVTR